MSTTTLIGAKTAAQFAIALALLITFSTGVMVGRHLVDEARTSSGSNNVRTMGPHFPYLLGQPYRKFALPGALREASAVSYVDDSHVAMVQDEYGTIFFYSIIESKITDEIAFASKGDFEGLVILGNEAWVLRSYGTLFQVSGLGEADPIVTKIETLLKRKDDTEGLTYNASDNQLLIGLKEPPMLDGTRRMDKRAVYAFRLDRKLMTETPYLLLDMTELKRVYNSQVSNNKAKRFDPERKTDFQPSDLAIHPITGHIYHIAARGQLLVVSDRSGQIYFVRDLPKERFRQPEGISFDPQGNMFIVNEGAGGNGMLFEFRYQPTPAKAEPDESVTDFIQL